MAYVWIIRQKQGGQLCHVIEGGGSSSDAIRGFLRISGIEVTPEAIEKYVADETLVTPWQSIFDLEVPCHLLEANFELMYGTGGHGGPIHGLRAAREEARKYLAGCRSESSVYLVPLDGRTLDRRNAIETIRR